MIADGVDAAGDLVAGDQREPHARLLPLMNAASEWQIRPPRHSPDAAGGGLGDLLRNQVQSPSRLIDLRGTVGGWDELAPFELKCRGTRHLC